MIPLHAVPATPVPPGTPPAQPAPPAVAIAQPGSRLEELLASYEKLKADAEEAASRFKALTDAIKAEANAMCPQAETVQVSGSPDLPRLRMTWVRQWRLDSKRMKEEQPVLYAAYAVRSGHWELRAQG